jgi:hypothetical protein
MAYVDHRYLEHQRKRFTRENAQLYIRHDAERFFLPGACPEEFKRPYPKSYAQRQREAEAEERAALEAAAKERAALEQEWREIEWNMAALRLQRAWLQLGIQQQKSYNPNQPRAPAGTSGGGQWTDGGGRPDGFRRRTKATGRWIRPRLS